MLIFSQDVLDWILKNYMVYFTFIEVGQDKLFKSKKTFYCIQKDKITY